MEEENKMNIYEELEEAVCENSESTLKVLEKMEDDERYTEKHLDSIKQIKNSIILIRDELAGKKLTAEGRTAIIVGIGALYNLLVYRDGDKKRESGLYAHKVYISSLYLVAIQLSRKWLYNLCYAIETSVYKFNKEDIEKALGIEEGIYKGTVVDRISKTFNKVMTFFMLVSVIGFILSFFLKKNEYIEISVLVMLLIVCGLYLGLKLIRKVDYFTSVEISTEDLERINKIEVDRL